MAALPGTNLLGDELSSVVDDQIAIQNAKTPSAPISCQRIALGVPGDYKPCIAMLPDGELLLAAFHNYAKDQGKILETSILFRSQDGGRVWSKAEELPLLGREPYLTVLNDGTLWITCHVLAQEVRNSHGYIHAYLHHSTDRGRTWKSTEILSDGIRPNTTIRTTRNILELPDGSLLLGVDCDGGPYFMWRSNDRGETWNRHDCQPAGFKSQFGFFGGETWLWQTKSGKILALVRVDSNDIPIAGRPMLSKSDESDHFMLWQSADLGETFHRVQDLGDYGEMYMSILRLKDQRLLLTFTVRDIKPPLGVRAVLGVEHDDGFTIDFDHDRIMLDVKTGSRPSGGGFGNTVQLADGTLVTPCTYRGEDDKTHIEVIRWRLPAAE